MLTTNVSCIDTNIFCSSNNQNITEFSTDYSHNIIFTAAGSSLLQNLQFVDLYS